MVAKLFKATRLQNLFSHTFVFVTLRNKYIHKCVSAVLLVMLLFIHSIKLLHTHSTNNSFSHHVCNGSCFEDNDHSEIATTSADCGICNYQLTKDADHILVPEFRSPIIEQTDLNAKLVSSYKCSRPPGLENRGPPSILTFC